MTGINLPLDSTLSKVILGLVSSVFLLPVRLDGTFILSSTREE